MQLLCVLWFNFLHALIYSSDFCYQADKTYQYRLNICTDMLEQTASTQISLFQEEHFDQGQQFLSFLCYLLHTSSGRLAPVLKTIFHQCVISYTWSQSNSDGSVLEPSELDWLQVYDIKN